ncbi:MAG: ATP-binding protein, partial [Proteobacteria bacterium]|nr:ATP-binding protein [Pseudomonadota bacterium]
MSILQEILDWSQGLPDWQSDAIRRLFDKGELSTDDMDDLFALLKAEHGIPDPDDRKANRLARDQVPVPAESGNYIKLVALKNFRHVNKIVENQRLPFSPDGLSPIFGENGSGKSGYTRVLKRACRAREQSEPILPNAFQPHDPSVRAEATLEFELNGRHEEANWIDGQPAPEILSTLAVFDSRCARSYLDDEGDFAYVPYGLDILEGLADACKRLKVMIERELKQTVVDRTVFAELAGDTQVGKLIDGLSDKTKREDVIDLATLTPEEQGWSPFIGQVGSGFKVDLAGVHYAAF